MTRDLLFSVLFFVLTFVGARAQVVAPFVLSSAAAAGGGEPTVVTDTVAAANHDAMSDPGDEGLIYGAQTYTVLAGTSYDPGPAQVGFMFPSSVPAASTLDSAVVQLYFNTNDHTGDTVGIFGYYEDNVAVFDGAHTHELTAHATLTTDSVVWAIPAGTDTVVNTPNLAAILQTIINRGGYAQGNRVGIVIRGWLDSWGGGEYQTIANYEAGFQDRKARIRWVYQ